MNEPKYKKGDIVMMDINGYGMQATIDHHYTDNGKFLYAIKPHNNLIVSESDVCFPFEWCNKGK